MELHRLVADPRARASGSALARRRRRLCTPAARWSRGCMTRTLTYPSQSLLGDYARAGIGVALTAGPLLIVPSGSVAVWILGALALLFLSFAARTALRHATRIEFGEDRISLFGPGQASFPWEALAAVKLSYYATASDRQGGWMQLTLRGAGGGTIRIDST